VERRTDQPEGRAEPAARVAARLDHPEAPDRSSDLPRIGFVGAGRVGIPLARAFAHAGWPVTAVASRHPQRRAAFRTQVPDAKGFAEPAAVLDESDLIFLTVPDDAIAPIAAELRLYSGQALVHTSGLLDASVLRPAMAAGTGAGSFHPLVAFADPDRAREALAGATIAVDGDESVVAVLAELAEAIGARPVRLPPGAKPAYHAAAVLAAGGFTALLDAIAELGRGAGLEEAAALAVYAPLIRQTLANAERLGIAAALTGPMVRGDEGTVRAHLAAMAELAPGARELYVAAARREISLAEGRGELRPDQASRLREALEATVPG
jgi:predicted short-subunit dehydrogenase-like oxidoreductase (DUF2520 family)